MAYTFSWVPTPGQNNSFVTNNNGTGRAIVNAEQYPFNSPLYICIPPITFQGGDAGATTLYDFAKTIATCGTPTRVQQPAINYNGKQIGGGALTVNGNPCGNYEFNVLADGTTLEQTDIANLFSTANDLSSWIVCRGDLILGSNVTLIPNVSGGYTRNDPLATGADASAKRRLFMVLYVTGNLTFGITSLISMSACGANSSSTGANIASFEIPVANGLTGPLDVKIAAAGDTPTAPDLETYTGISGPSGTVVSNVYSTGGGGSGFVEGGDAAVYAPGSGGAGSCFSGGAGGGTSDKLTTTQPTSGSSLGGIGGTTGNTVPSGYGGTGNPGGAGPNTGISGTGGILIIIVGGGMLATGDGSLAANGVTSGPTNSGGASGAGIILQLTGNGTSCSSLYTSGGARFGTSAQGGPGTSGVHTL